MSTWQTSAAFVLGAAIGIGLIRWRVARAKGEENHVVDRVRESCARVAERLQSVVKINSVEVESVAKSAILSKIPLWDEYEWHCSVKDYGEVLTARYVFVLDAVNYCFWPSTRETGLEYEHLARGLKRACDRGELFLDLEECTMDRLSSWLEHPHRFPLAETRLEAIRGLGRAWRLHGDAIDWLAHANFSAVRLVDLIVARLQSFKDETVFEGQPVCFYKRAQILVADIFAAFAHATKSGKRLHSIDRLTMFADYRVPQILRDLNVLEYSPELAQKVDSLQELRRDCAEEIAIRAATVHAVELIKRAMNARLTSVEIDWIFWQTGEAKKDTLRPHHCTLTTCY